MAVKPGPDGSISLEKCGLQLHSKLGDGVQTIALCGEIDLSNADLLCSELERGMDANARIRIDMSALEFIDSQGIRSLITAADGLGKSQPLEVVRPPAHVARLLSLTGVDEKVRIV